MKLSIFSAAAITAVACFVEPSIAQSPEMPEPLAVVVDADGKPVVQVTGINTAEIWVLFDFDGVPVAARLFEINSQFDTGRNLYFSNPDCTGEAYISEFAPFGLEFLNQQSHRITGPDADTGAYRVFRSTSTSTVQVNPQSQWFDSGNLGVCGSHGGTLNLLTAEEVLPNPLEGFHGPTTDHRERRLMISGGTRLP